MKDTIEEKIFFAINYFVLFLIGLSCIIPIIHIFALSFSDPSAIMSGFVTLWPVGWNLEAYSTLLTGTNIVRGFVNNVIITVVGVILSMIFTILAAYPLSRPYFYFRRSITLAIVFTMLFTGGVVPTYLVFKSLGFVNSYWAIWMFSLMSPFNMLVMKTFFENLPVEMEEAARIDGCSEAQLIYKVVLPLSKPVIATLILFYGVTYWNVFMNVLIYITDSAKFNLTVMVQQMVQSQSLMQQLNILQPEDIKAMTPESIKAAAIIFMVTPMLIVYPFIQKNFVKGVMIGAIKG